MNSSKAIGAVLALAGGLAAGTAQARTDVQWSLSIGAPVYVQPAPVYVQPAPVYHYAPQVVYRPVPVYVEPVYYVQPQPVYLQAWGGNGHRHGGRHWKHRGHR